MSLTRYNEKTPGSNRVPTGQADEIVISEASFRSAHRAFEQSKDDSTSSKKRKREAKGDPAILYGPGAYKGPWARWEERRPDVTEPDESGSEEIEYVYETDEEEEIAPQPAAPKSKAGTAYEETGDGKETSEFHGSEMYDYQGRTYMHVPQDLDIDLLRDYPLAERKNYTPKKLIHTWKGHTKAIMQTRFFPDSGHLLLSASADAKIKLWDVYHSRELLRTFSGHSKGVTDIDFEPSGESFISGSFDRSMKLWDTETGACKARFSTGATPHVLRFNPSLPQEFLAGMGDKKIVQFDVRTSGSKPVQEYDHHLGPVNTVTFCDENRRFITTSDDKSLRAWEYGIPVPIKFIADPSMFAMTRSSPHPSGKSAAFQSSDNQIVVYSCDNKFRQNHKKTFKGHNNAGYAIDVAISPDGSLVASGDSAGFVCFWGWRDHKMYHKIMTNKEGAACTTVAWQPRETSKVVTGSVDGALKYWD